MDRLKDKVCIITGAAQGIGRSMAELFAAQGAKMVIAVDMTEAEFAQKNIRAATLNVTDKAGVGSLVNSVWNEFGRLDVIVNNAGITRDALCSKMTDEQWDLVMDVNLKAAHYMVAAAAPYLMEQGSGSIISLSSVVGIFGNVGQANYAATKAGIIALSKTWTKELSRRGGKIRANCIAPGFVATPILDTIPAEVMEKTLQKVMFKEVVQPEDIANAALFLASDESRYVTGQTLQVCGGYQL